MGDRPREDAGRDESRRFGSHGDCKKKQEAGMNKPLICTTILMSAALVAGAAVDADNIYHRIFPETRIVEYRREVKAGDTLWDICGEIATDKEDLRKLVYQAKKDNRIRDVGNLQPGMLIVVRVEEARNG